MVGSCSTFNGSYPRLARRRIYPSREGLNGQHIELGEGNGGDHRTPHGLAPCAALPQTAIYHSVTSPCKSILVRLQLATYHNRHGRQGFVAPRRFSRTQRSNWPDPWVWGSQSSAPQGHHAGRPRPHTAVFLDSGPRPNARFQALCKLAAIRPRLEVETGRGALAADLWKTWRRPTTTSTPLAFRAIMTLPEPVRRRRLVRPIRPARTGARTHGCLRAEGQAICSHRHRRDLPQLLLGRPLAARPPGRSDRGNVPRHSEAVGALVFVHGPLEPLS